MNNFPVVDEAHIPYNLDSIGSSVPVRAKTGSWSSKFHSRSSFSNFNQEFYQFNYSSSRHGFINKEFIFLSLFLFYKCMEKSGRLVLNQGSGFLGVI